MYNFQFKILFAWLVDPYQFVLEPIKTDIQRQGSSSFSSSRTWKLAYHRPKTLIQFKIKKHTLYSNGDDKKGAIQWYNETKSAFFLMELTPQGGWRNVSAWSWCWRRRGWPPSLCFWRWGFIFVHVDEGTISSLWLSRFQDLVGKVAWRFLIWKCTKAAIEWGKKTV